MRHFAAGLLGWLATSAPLLAQGFCPPPAFLHPLPPFGLPGPWGWPPVVVVPQPVVVVPSPAFLPFPAGVDLADLREPDRPQDDPALAAVRVDAAVRRGDLLVVDPKGNGIKLAEGLRPVPKPEANVPPRPPIPLPPNDPVELAAFHIGRAKAAFETGELGRATERLQAAIDARPDAALPHFLLVPVRTARGQYREAVLALRDGLRLDRDWPTAPHRLADFYGAKADRLRADRAELELALAAKPDDPVLLVLSGYYHWFDGDRAEATKRFAKAAKLVRDPEPIERFLTPDR